MGRGTPRLIYLQFGAPVDLTGDLRALAAALARPAPGFKHALEPPAEHEPGETASTAGTYEQLNIFGQPTGIRVNIADGHRLPAAPLGHNWILVDEAGAAC